MIYFTDEFVVVDVKKDKNGLITETDLPAEKGKMFDYNRYIIDTNGNEVMAEGKIDLDKNSLVKPGFKIKIKKRCGSAYELPDKKFLIKKIQRSAAFTSNYIRVFI